MLRRAAMSWSEIVFTTVGGLRGAISLILVQQVVTESSPGQEDQKVNAEARARPAGPAPPVAPKHMHVCCRLRLPWRPSEGDPAGGGDLKQEAPGGRARSWRCEGQRRWHVCCWSRAATSAAVGQVVYVLNFPKPW